MKLKNLLIISGTGSKSGKTTMACRIIHEFRHLQPVAIKITPHYHELTEGIEEIAPGDGYSIRIERDPCSGKDTSRMLAAGASTVYLALAWEAPLEEVFIKLLELIPEGIPIICESPSLRNYFEPGVFIIMSSPNVVPRGDLVHLEHFPHLKFNLEDDADTLKISFSGGSWIV